MLQIQTGKVRTHIDEGDSPWETAIYKEAVTTPIGITSRGLDGDERTGYDVDRALCCQSVDNYRFWSAYFRRDFPLGSFGENVVLEGYTDETVCIGDIVRCGTALLQITQPRTPCYKQAKKIGVPTFVRLLEQTQRRGFLLRVLKPGTFGVGDAFETLERPRPDAPLLYVNRTFFDKPDQETLRWLAELEPFAHDWREKASQRLAEYAHAVSNE
ncbi:MAG: MOSC domain-containing protein [Chloroflexota bacterium]